MKLIIELDEKQFKDIQRIASIQIRRRSLTCEQIIANGKPLEDELDRIMREIDDLKWTSMAVDFRNEVFEIIEENKQ